MLLNPNEAGKIAPIVEEILFQSRRVGKDWIGKRVAHFKIPKLLSLLVYKSTKGSKQAAVQSIFYISFTIIVND